MGRRPMIRRRLGLVALCVAVVGAVGWWMWTPRPPPPPAPVPPPIVRDGPRPPLRPDGIEAVQTPIAGDPGPEIQGAVLDQLEDYEADRFGPSEAARRRRTRERLLEGRIER